MFLREKGAVHPNGPVRVETHSMLPHVAVNGVVCRFGTPVLDADMMHIYPHRHATDGFFAAAMERAPQSTK